MIRYFSFSRLRPFIYFTRFDFFRRSQCSHSICRHRSPINSARLKIADDSLGKIAAGFTSISRVSIKTEITAYYFRCSSPGLMFLSRKREKHAGGGEFKKRFP